MVLDLAETEFLIVNTKKARTPREPFISNKKRKKGLTLLREIIPFFAKILLSNFRSLLSYFLRRRTAPNPSKSIVAGSGIAVSSEINVTVTFSDI